MREGGGQLWPVQAGTQHSVSACNEISCLRRKHAIKLSLSCCQTTKHHTHTKNVWDNFYVLHKSRIPERSSVCCTSPFISLKAYSCQKIRTTLLDILSLKFLSGNTSCVHAHTHKHTHVRTPVHKFAVFFLCYITVSGSHFFTEC